MRHFGDLTVSLKLLQLMNTLKFFKSTLSVFLATGIGVAHSKMRNLLHNYSRNGYTFKISFSFASLHTPDPLKTFFISINNKSIQPVKTKFQQKSVFVTGEILTFFDNGMDVKRRVSSDSGTLFIGG